MMRLRRVRYLAVVVGVLALLLAVAACSSSSGSTAAPTTTTTVLPAAPSEVQAATDQWPLPGQNYDNARAARTTISSANVQSLTPAWTDKDALGQLTTAPIVANGIVYLQDGNGKVLALDAQSGSVRWASSAFGPNIGPFGVAIGDGRVYALDGSTGVVALDLRTGHTIWKKQLTTTHSLGIDIQPTVFGGMVFAATVPVSLGGIYTPGDRGVLYALNDRTGAIRWSFDTVQGDLWGHPDVNSGGGAWYPPAIDTQRRTIFFGTANPAPFPGTAQYPNGASRPGPNLYTDSVLALNIDTGKLRWYHQVTPHDLFDRDQVHVLLARQGAQEVVVSAGKSGEVVGLDPDTGRVLWQTPVGRHDHDDAPLTGPIEVYPGTYGGVLTPPATADGVVYLATLNSPTKLQPDAVSYFGSELGTSDGEMYAVDAGTGKVLWHSATPGDPLGGATVVNDLVLTATDKSAVVAYRRSDGTRVWSYRAPGAINGWLSVVGDSMYIPVGQATPPQVVALRLR